MPTPSVIIFMTKSEKYYTIKKYKIKGEKRCIECERIFNIYITRDLQRKKYCSVKCRKFGTAKILSEKMKLGLIPKPPRGTKESYAKVSLKMRAENHPKWIKDRNKIKRSRFNNSERKEGPIASWRSFIFRRDNYTCQNCKTYGGKLNAHHIKSWAQYPKFRFDYSNGVTLCVKCHKEEHRKLKYASTKK